MKRTRNLKSNLKNIKKQGPGVSADIQKPRKYERQCPRVCATTLEPRRSVCKRLGPRKREKRGPRCAQTPWNPENTKNAIPGCVQTPGTSKARSQVRANTLEPRKHEKRDPRVCKHLEPRAREKRDPKCVQTPWNPENTKNAVPSVCKHPGTSKTRKTRSQGVCKQMESRKREKHGPGVPGTSKMRKPMFWVCANTLAARKRENQGKGVYADMGPGPHSVQHCKSNKSHKEEKRNL
jgi:hypothetical protein